MTNRTIRRALVGAATALILTTTAALADTVLVDGDTVTAGDQTTIDLGSALPGADVPVALTFRVECSGTSHVDPGQSVRLSPGSRTIPPGGGFGVGSITLTPGAGWPADGDACPADLSQVSGVLHMVVTAPPDRSVGPSPRRWV